MLDRLRALLGPPASAPAPSAPAQLQLNVPRPIPVNFARVDQIVPWQVGTYVGPLLSLSPPPVWQTPLGGQSSSGESLIFYILDRPSAEPNSNGMYRLINYLDGHTYVAIGTRAAADVLRSPDYVIAPLNHQDIYVPGKYTLSVVSALSGFDFTTVRPLAQTLPGSSAPRGGAAGLYLYPLDADLPFSAPVPSRYYTRWYDIYDISVVQPHVATAANTIQGNPNGFQLVTISANASSPVSAEAFNCSGAVGISVSFTIGNITSGAGNSMTGFLCTIDQNQNVVGIQAPLTFTLANGNYTLPVQAYVLTGPWTLGFTNGSATTIATFRITALTANISINA